jgi:uncharacterized lipoprotein YmbA
MTGVLRSALSDLATMLVLGSAACGMSGPPPVEYVLAAAPAATTATSQVTELPVLQVMTVRLPDYLDTTDLLVRNGNQLTPSKNGRWGERLSVGMTRALASDLAARLPNIVVTTTPSVKSPERRLLVDVSAFEARPDRQVVLAARWTITDGGGHTALLSEQAVLTETAVAMGDDGVVTAMTKAVDALASRIAAQNQLARWRQSDAPQFRPSGLNPEVLSPISDRR